VPFGCRPSLLGRPVPRGHRRHLTMSLLPKADPIGVATFRIGKVRRASWPLDAGSRAPSQHARSPCWPSLQAGRLSHIRPHSHDDASTKASLTFNSTPTVPGIDFGCGSLLSCCVYRLLETPPLPATPRPYGNGLSVLAQSEIRHLTYATACRTSDPRI
jgi:hypothetical protein